MYEEAQPRKSKASTVVVLCVVGITVLALLTAGGTWLWKNVLKDPVKTEKQSKTYSKDIGQLDIVGDAGNITITGTDSDKITVDRTLKWDSEKPKSVEGFHDNRLSINIDGCEFELFGQDDCEIAYNIKVPKKVVIDARADSGDVSTNNISADEKLEADSGEVRTNEVDGKVAIHTDSGDVKIDDIEGDVNASSDSGEVTARKVTGNFTADTDSGNIDGSGVTAKKVEVTTDSGNSTLSFDKAPQSITEDADSGNLTVNVPNGKDSYNVDTTTDSGSEDVKVHVDSNADRTIKLTSDSGNLTVGHR